MSFEAIAYVRKRGAIGVFEPKWLTVPTQDRAAAQRAFDALGFETRGLAVVTQEEASQLAARF